MSRWEKKAGMCRLFADTEFKGDTSNKRDQFLIRCNAHANEPFFVVAGRLKGPVNNIKL